MYERCEILPLCGVLILFFLFILSFCIAARKCWTCGEFYSTGRQK